MTAACRTRDNHHADGLPAGFSLHHVETVGSTNDEASKLADGGAASGTVLLADRQTAGRGRLGRRWHSKPGNLHASILLRPDCALKAASQLSLLAGVALADILVDAGPSRSEIKLKWPNDVLIDGGKVAGILLESAGDKNGRLAHVILGVGVNLVWAPDDVGYTTTSLEAKGFPKRSPAAWLSAYTARLAHWLDRWRHEGFADVRNAWRARSYGLGGPIRLRLDREEVDGRFVDLTEAGALLIERADGTRRELTAGDVDFADH
ncbi:MAG: biotin--[acetyl-CoA-carboxylase] ligase [Geminicoccaceae bacterium]